MASNKEANERARDLVGTSVEDLQSSLWFYQWDVKINVETIRRGLAICERRGEKTKATILRRKLNVMEKNIATFEASMNKEAEDASV